VHLLDRLAKSNFDKIDPALRANILAFYGDPAAPLAPKKNSAAWRKMQDQLDRLRSLPDPARVGNSETP
jgi:hypothetical protein